MFHLGLNPQLLESLFRRRAQDQAAAHAHATDGHSLQWFLRATFLGHLLRPFSMSS